MRQSTTTLRLNSGDLWTVWFELQNTGRRTWTHGSFSRLGTQSPQDRTSPFVQWSWITPNRPTTANATTPTGSVARYSFTIKAPDVTAVATYHEVFQQVEDGVTWFGPQLAIDIIVSPPPVRSFQPIEWNSNLLAQSERTLAMRSGETRTVWCDWLNTGTRDWTHAGMSRLGTFIPQDRPSAFADASWLYSNNRPTTVDATTPMGRIGRYTFTLTAPSVTTRTTFHEVFSQVEDGVAWFGVPAVFDVMVDPAGGAPSAPPAPDTWRLRAPMPTPRRDFIAVADDAGRIHCIGGFALNENVATHEVYDPIADAWETKSPMPTRRGHYGAALLAGKIYVVAGEGGAPVDRLATVECYDVASDAWTTLAPLPEVRGEPVVAAIAGKVWAYGGWKPDPHSPFAAVWQTFAYVYDPATNAWSRGPDLGVGASVTPAATVAAGSLVMFDGNVAGASNPIADVTWGPNAIGGVPLGGGFAKVTGATSPTIDFAPLGAAATIGTRAYVVGGRRWSVVSASLHSIDASALPNVAMQTHASMRFARTYCGAAASGGKLYVMGGDDLGYGAVAWVEEYTP